MSSPSTTPIVWPLDWKAAGAFWVCALLVLASALGLAGGDVGAWTWAGLLFFGLGVPVLGHLAIRTRLRFGVDAFEVQTPLCSRQRVPYASVTAIGTSEIRADGRRIALPEPVAARVTGELRRRMEAAGVSPEANRSCLWEDHAEAWRAREREATARRVRRHAPEIALYRDTPLDSRLAEAVEAGSIPALRSALASGAAVNARGYSGLTPLMLAARREWTAGARILLDAGADTRPRDAAGRSAADLDVVYEGERGEPDTGGAVAALIAKHEAQTAGG